MILNYGFINAPQTIAWLGQFDPSDQKDVVRLLGAMRLVSRDEFAEGLRSLLVASLSSGPGPVGIYVEREVPKRKAEPAPLFKQSNGTIRRAYGQGPKLVDPTRPFDPSVGSEGLIAQMVSEFCSEHSGKCLPSPGPTAIRKYKVRRFILVTDFVGTGQRVQTYLNAAWKVRSVRSWWSSRKNAGLSFEVVAYAGTVIGRALVEGHASRPLLRTLAGCPTIADAFPEEVANRLKDLCFHYAPRVRGTFIPPLGWGNVGALIAFPHGVPNNVPAMLFRSAPDWSPLFPQQKTSETRAHFGSTLTSDEIAARLHRLREIRLANASSRYGRGTATARRLLLLATLRRSPRTDDALSHKTGLTVPEVQEILATAFDAGLVDSHRRLTDNGQAELLQARKQVSKSRPSLSMGSLPLYYPIKLRAPVDASR